MVFLIVSGRNDTHPPSLSFFERARTSAGPIPVEVRRVFSSDCIKFHVILGEIFCNPPKSGKSIDFCRISDTINIISRLAGETYHDRGAARQEYPPQTRQTPGRGKGPPPKRPYPVWGRTAGPPENIRRTVTRVESCHDGADFSSVQS